MPKVDGFRDAEGVLHLPGEIVDLPANYDGERWLKRVEPEQKPVAPPAKLELAEAPETVPLEDPSQKKIRKKSKS